jgi:DGQHR domain-containing protein
VTDGLKVDKHKHVGTVKHPLVCPAIEIEQTANKLYFFKAAASELYNSLSINRKEENKSKDEGYQRVLSPSRVQAISRYIAQKRALPGAIIVGLDKASYDAKKCEITIPAGTDVGWVIDGQHRLAGAEMASRLNVSIELPVVAFIGLTQDKQIEQFVVINREAKNVPTSLYLDLLGKLPQKKAADAARERAVDLATELRRDEESPFFQRIVVTVAPKPGQISLTNFVRKITPLVTQDKGLLGSYTEREQLAVIGNYYEALRQVFPKEFDSKQSMFFKTIGFGALWNVFPSFFSLSLNLHKGFQVKDVVQIFKKIADSVDFPAWNQYGTGNQAETLAGEDLRTTLLLAFSKDGKAKGTLRV